MASTRSPRDVWKQLVDEAGEEMIEQAASVSVEQAEKELRAFGFDVAAERAKARAFLEDLEHGTERQHLAPAQPAMAPPAPRRKRPVTLWLAAAAVVAAGGAVALHVTLREHPTPAPPAPSTREAASAPPVDTFAPPDLVAAADWRSKAVAACDARQWEQCLADLDIARAIDPDGDDTPLVKSTRQRAIDGVLRKPPKPPIP